MEHCFGSSRIVIGDSYFGSLKTAIALRSKGLYFIGCVKTGHKGFPKFRLKEHLVSRGDQCFMEA